MPFFVALVCGRSASQSAARENAAEFCGHARVLKPWGLVNRKSVLGDPPLGGGVSCSMRFASNFLPLLLPCLPAVAPNAQRSQVLHHVLPALCLGRDVIDVGFTFIRTHAPTVLAGPCVTHEHTLTQGIPRS